MRRSVTFCVRVNSLSGTFQERSFRFTSSSSANLPSSTSFIAAMAATGLLLEPVFVDDRYADPRHVIRLHPFHDGSWCGRMTARHNRWAERALDSLDMRIGLSVQGSREIAKQRRQNDRQRAG